METYFLTENISINNDIMFYHSKKITNNNWHLYLTEYGWNKMPLRWVKKLNKLTSIKSRNSRYGVYSCPEDGDCFFPGLDKSLDHLLLFIRFQGFPGFSEF